MKFTTIDLHNLARTKRDEYATAAPFPNIVLPGVFDYGSLSAVLQEILAMNPALFSYGETAMNYKGGCSDAEVFPPLTRDFFQYAASVPFITFLETLTGISGLIADPALWGGGIHIVKNGGHLGIHSDFNKHKHLKLDRRLNVLIYMNKNWEDEYGGHFELWDKEMKNCVVKIRPDFNTMAIFSTTRTSYHGHPDPMTCPPDRMRIGLNLYYYTAGRTDENVGVHSTLFQARKGSAKDRKDKAILFVKQFVPPIAYRLWHKIKP